MDHKASSNQLVTALNDNLPSLLLTSNYLLPTTLHPLLCTHYYVLTTQYPYERLIK